MPTVTVRLKKPVTLIDYNLKSLQENFFFSEMLLTSHLLRFAVHGAVPRLQTAVLSVVSEPGYEPAR